MDANNIHVRGERDGDKRRRWKKRKELNCYYCGEKGHFARNCPEIRCWECGKKGHEKKTCFIKFFRMFANWNKRMNDYSARWKEYIQKMIINNENKNVKINSEIKKNEEIKNNANVDFKDKNENVDFKDKNENEINKKDTKSQEKIEKDVEKDKNKSNNNKMQDIIKIEENSMKFKNDKKSALIDKIEYHQQINIQNKINNNLKSNILKIKNNSKNNENNGSKNNKIIRSKIKQLKRSIDQWIYDFDKDKINNVKFYYKKNNVLNINELYDINIDEKVYCLKEINPHLIDPYATVNDFEEEIFFDKKTNIEISSCYKYKEFIINLRNLLLKLKDKDEINIILHIIDTESNLYITQKYKKLDSKLKEKDKWIYYDEYGWGNLVPRNEKEFDKEEFINEFTYAYEDI